MYRNLKRNLPRSLLMGTLIRRREDPDFTEMMNEIGTTKESIGDATIEVMLTTPGEIPEQFYDFDASRESLDEHQSSDGDRKGAGGGFGAHSTLFSFLIISLILLIMICCISACVIARARRKYEVSSDMECDADCQGNARQPLINSDKLSETTSKTTNSTKR